MAATEYDERAEDAPEGAEPEHDDDEGAEAAQAPPTAATAAPAEPMSEREIKAAIRRLEAQAKRHRRTVADILGDDATALVPCELCEPHIPGFHWPIEQDPSLRERMAALAGSAETSELRVDPDAERCDVCDGHGELLTGSRVAGSETRPCGKCGAKGWTTDEERRTHLATMQARAAMAPTYQAAPTAREQEETLPQFDPWARPRGHHYYGRNPQYMTPAERSTDWPGVS